MNTGSKRKEAEQRLHRLLREARSTEEAIGLLESATKLNRLDAYAWSALSDLYGEAEEWKSALETARTAVQLEPNEGVFHFNLAVFYFMACANSRMPQSNYCTLEALGLDYKQARAEAESHYREAIRLTDMPDIRKGANEGLANLRLLDNWPR